MSVGTNQRPISSNKQRPPNPQGLPLAEPEKKRKRVDYSDDEEDSEEDWRRQGKTLLVRERENSNEANKPGTAPSSSPEKTSQKSPVADSTKKKPWEGPFGMPKDWYMFLKEERQLAKFDALCAKVESEYQRTTVYPPKEDIFRAFKFCPVIKTKVVVIGQDPYMFPGQAQGMSFSVPDGVKIPPSLENIFKAIKIDYPEFQVPTSGNLEGWARQGVLLLNSTLTVIHGQPNSHVELGWIAFTDQAIKKMSTVGSGLVFLLWGNNARAKKALIDTKKHLVLESVHPSPKSADRGFFECHHFRKANEWFEKHGRSPIKW